MILRGESRGNHRLTGPGATLSNIKTTRCDLESIAVLCGEKLVINHMYQANVQNTDSNTRCTHCVRMCHLVGLSIFCAKMPDFHLRKIEYSGRDPLPL